MIMKKIFKVVFLIIVIIGISAAIFIIIRLEKNNFKQNESIFFDQSKIAADMDYKLSEGDSIEISEVPIVAELTQDEYKRVFYIDGNIKRGVTHNSHPIDYLIFSPSKNKFGYFENLDIYDKNVPYDKQLILHVVDQNTKDKKEIYHGSFRTSDWEWFSEKEILVGYNCGTECKVLYLIDIDSNKRHTLQYGVGYQWSPNKELVFAYHYTAAYGITVGDKFGNETFNLRRDKNFSELIWKTKAAWSPDSKKLALIIKKENQEKLELLVFDVENNFKTIYQKDLEANDFNNLSWQNNQVVSYQIGDEIKKILITKIF